MTQNSPTAEFLSQTSKDHNSHRRPDPGGRLQDRLRPHLLLRRPLPPDRLPPPGGDQPPRKRGMVRHEAALLRSDRVGHGRGRAAA